MRQDDLQEVVFKHLLLLALSILLTALTFSGWEFWRGNYDEKLMLMNAICGVLFGILYDNTQLC